jgi:hypothetical protein
MAAKKRTGKVTDVDWTAQGDKYLQRLLHDQELRNTLLGDYGSARSAYGRLSNGKGATHALFEDPKLQKELIDTATRLRDATTALAEPSAAPKRRRRRAGRRTLALLFAGALLALVLSEDLRSKVLDMLFGAEEEFDYTSTTAPSTPAPAGVAGG